MERNFNPIIFVKVDLLLHEESFKALKEFVCQDTTTKTYSSLDYCPDKNEIIVTEYSELFKNAFLSLIAHKVTSDYILLDYQNLKKLLGLVWV